MTNVIVRSWITACLFSLCVSTAAAQTVVLVGDSTIAPNTGYGEALCERLRPAIACINLAKGGRSTLTYRAEGHWNGLLRSLKVRRSSAEPVHVLIQFGHNDQPGKLGRMTELETEFPSNLRQFVDDVREASAVPVLVTPLTRRTFEGELLKDNLLPWSLAIQGVAAERGVALLDLHAKSYALVQGLGQEEADKLAEAAPKNRRFDRTHLGERGACVFSEIMSHELASRVPVLDKPRTTFPDCGSIPPPAEQFSRGAADVPGWTNTKGGQGGVLLRVTNLDANGPGSLKAAIETPGPRTVVFEVGGAIDMKGVPMDIRHPHITIAGQTAPNPGITILRSETTIRTHDVIIQHLRFRPGVFGRTKRSGESQDGLSTLGGAHNVLVDHCSFSWGTDENLSASGPRFAGETPEEWRLRTSHQITYAHNLIYEGLSNSIHAKGEHSKGSLIHDNTSKILLYGNVYISNKERNALFKGGSHGAMINNLIFNPGRFAIHYNLWSNEWVNKPLQVGRLSLIGNQLRYGPNTQKGVSLFTLRGEGPLQLTMFDNHAEDRDGRLAPLLRDQSNGQAVLEIVKNPDIPTGLRIRPPASLMKELHSIVGARPWNRDNLDQHAVDSMLIGKGRIIDREDDNPIGVPQIDEPVRRKFNEELWNLDDMSPKAGWNSLYSRKVAPVW